MPNRDLIIPASISLIGDITSGSASVASIFPSTSGIPVGAVVEGPGITDFAVVRSIDSASAITISAPAYASSSGASMTIPLEPVSLADVKAHLRVTHDDEDSTIAGFIATAREQLEGEARRDFLAKTYDFRFDTFGVGYDGATSRAIRQMGINPFLFGLSSDPIRLPYGPITAVVSITYRSVADGSLVILDPSAYRLSPGERARVEPAYGCTWPATMPGIDGVVIRCVSGYGLTPSSVPMKYRQAMKLLVAYYWENRNPNVRIADLSIPDDIMRLVSVGGRGYQ